MLLCLENALCIYMQRNEEMGRDSLNKALITRNESTYRKQRPCVPYDSNEQCEELK